MRLGTVKLLAPAIALTAALAIHVLVPNVYPEDYVPTIYGPVLTVCLVAYLALAVASAFFEPLRQRLVRWSWFLMAIVVLLEGLDILTLKTGICQLPYVPSPDRVLSTMISDSEELLEGIGSSMGLLWSGVAIGMVAGTVSGLLMGWSRFCDYWIMGLLRVIGPIPSAVWLPLAMILMPTGRVAALFIISMAVWFPLTMMLGTAIKSTPRSYIEAARCLGAKGPQLLFKVAWPNALPGYFDGMFMGLASSFGALVVAEMLGSQSGLGFIVNWARTWAQFNRVFMVALVMIVLFALIIALLFLLRRKVLRWSMEESADPGVSPRTLVRRQSKVAESARGDDVASGGGAREADSSLSPACADEPEGVGARHTPEAGGTN